MVNISELAPEALTLVSSAGVVTPEVMPELLPIVPEISEAASKPTHLITPGWAHRVGKSWLPVIGGNTVTITDAFVVPPDPVHARLNVLVLVNAFVDRLPPEGGVAAPDQPPDAAQEVALVDDQVRIDDPPLGTDAGLAVSDTVGGTVVPGTAGLPEPAPDATSTAVPLQAENARPTMGMSKVLIRGIGNLVDQSGQDVYRRSR
jgi:hypothetical protein